MVLGYILLLVGLNIYGADKEIPVNTDDPNGVICNASDQLAGRTESENDAARGL